MPLPFGGDDRGIRQVCRDPGRWPRRRRGNLVGDDPRNSRGRTRRRASDPPVTQASGSAGFVRAPQSAPRRLAPRAALCRRPSRCVHPPWPGPAQSQIKSSASLALSAKPRTSRHAAVQRRGVTAAADRRRRNRGEIRAGPHDLRRRRRSIASASVTGGRGRGGCGRGE